MLIRRLFQGREVRQRETGRIRRKNVKTDLSMHLFNSSLIVLAPFLAARDTI